MRVWIMGILAMLILSSCSEVQKNPPLIISTDTWIGAAPLYYAHSMGWLREANIEMLQADSINETLERYDSKAADIVTGTDDTYLRLKQKHSDLIPIIIYDRSYGGDMILSNKTLLEIRESHKKIALYLEKDTVSEKMLSYFLTDNNFSIDKFTLYNRAQSEIAKLRSSPASAPMIAITYSPNDAQLIKKGFFEIASSENDRYLIVDCFYISRNIRSERAEQTKILRDVFSKAVRAYHKNPKAFYQTVKPYLGGITYDEFNHMAHDVRWTDDYPLTGAMLERLQKSGLPTQELLP